MKICTVCKVEKPLDDFHRRNTAKDGRQNKCKECNSNQTKNWQAKNWDRVLEGQKRRDSAPDSNHRRRARKYGMSSEELEQFLLAAEGKCTICGRHPNQWLVVDHDHSSGNVRGVLCEKCKQALGLMEDNIEYLSSAIKYLKKYK